MFGNQTLEFYGLKTAPIMRAEPTDLPQIQIDERRMDFVFYLADDTYLHIEFQTDFTQEDLERFKLYDALLYEQKKKPVHTAVIYGAGISDTPTTLDHGSLKYFTHAVYMGRYNGDEIYKELSEKVNQGITLEIIDKLNLIFLPLMKNSVDKSQRAIDAVEIAQRVPDKNEQLFLIGCLVGISDKFIDKMYIQKFMEVLRMTQVLQALYKEFKEEGIAEGLEKGRAEGRTEGKIEGEIKGEIKGRTEAICRFLKSRFGLNSIKAQKKVKKIIDLDILDDISEKIYITESLDEIQKTIDKALEVQKKIK